MVSESCSTSSGSKSASSSAEAAASDAATDRMVKIEMEAAEALADLAYSAGRGGPSYFGGKMAGKGKRGKKSVKCESPRSRSMSNQVDSAPSWSDLAQDSPVLLQQPNDAAFRNLLDPAKAEQDGQLLDQSDNCTSSYLLLGGGRSRQNFSEAEKEAKRLRRVLANRESARRTIRRRQALCEELARKAAELTEENENLRKGKESALREYQLLETTNKKLKASIAMADKCDVGSKLVLRPACTEVSPSPANLPMILHNTPFAPFPWPPLIQASQQGVSAPSGIPSHITDQGSCNPDPSKEHSSINIPGPTTPLYILPVPWLFSLPDQVYHWQASCCHKYKENGKLVEMNNQQEIAASAVVTDANAGKPDTPLPRLVRAETAGPSVEIRIINDLNEVPVESFSDLSVRPFEVECEEMALEATARSSATDSITHDSMPKLNLPEKADPIPVSLAPRNMVISEQVKNCQELPTISCKKQINATAAAEARRRRKELTKLKALHGRQCRMHC